MNAARARCLILACGNTLRGDDGLGPWLAAWAESRFSDEADVQIISRQQWTPDLAEDLAEANSVLFIDCSIESDPGSILLRPVKPSTPRQGLAIHHQGAPELLALALELYGRSPDVALLLTVGACSIELGEGFSEKVKSKLPLACLQVEEAVSSLLNPFRPA